MKTVKIIFLVLFGLLLLVPIVTFNFEENYQSDIDNRYLNEITNESLQEDFSGTIENYINDRIGLRENMNGDYISFNYYLFNLMLHDSYDAGTNGELYPTLYENPKYDDVKSSFVSAISRINKYCEERGVKVYFTMDPDKTCIYDEYLPQGTNINNDWVKEFYTQIEAEGITYVNNHELFESLKDEYTLYNKKEDVGHYNAYGAFFAMNNVLEKIAEDFPNIDTYNIEDMEVIDEICHYLPNSRFVTDDVVPKFLIDETWIWLDETQYIRRDSLFGNFMHTINYNEEYQKYPKVMCFQGSHYWGNTYKNVLINKTREFIGIHNYLNIFNFEYYFNIYKPEVVIIDVSEHTIENYFFPCDDANSMVLQKALDLDTYQNVETDKIETEFNYNDKFVQLVINTELVYDYAYVCVGDEYYDVINMDGKKCVYQYIDQIENGEEIKVVLTDINSGTNYTQVIEK